MTRPAMFRVYTYLDIIRDGKEIEVRVTADYYNEVPASYFNKYGDPGDPYQPPYLKNIKCQKGYELTQEEYEAAEKKIMDCPYED